MLHYYDKIVRRSDIIHCSLFMDTTCVPREINFYNHLKSKYLKFDQLYRKELC